MTNAPGPSPLRGLHWRALAASATALVGAAVFRANIHDNEASVWVPPVAIAAGAAAIHFRPLGAQLLGRALFWSNFVLGMLLCFLSHGNEQNAGIGLVLGCGASLALAERRALAEAAAAGSFKPAAFAGTIELVMVLALADAQTCFLFAALDKYGRGMFALATVAFVVGFVGLYRLRLWGIVVTMSTAALLGVAMLAGFVNMHDVRLPLVVVFSVQLVAPMPMLVSMATKRPLPSAPPRVRSVLATASVGFLVVVALVAAALRR